MTLALSPYILEMSGAVSAKINVGKKLQAAAPISSIIPQTKKANFIFGTISVN